MISFFLALRKTCPSGPTSTSDSDIWIMFVSMMSSFLYAHNLNDWHPDTYRAVNINSRLMFWWKFARITRCQQTPIIVQIIHSVTTLCEHTALMVETSIREANTLVTHAWIRAWIYKCVHLCSTIMWRLTHPQTSVSPGDTLFDAFSCSNLLRFSLTALQVRCEGFHYSEHLN